MFKGCPKKEDGPFCLPDVCLGALFYNSSPLIISLPLWPSFLCCETFFERRTPQAWIHDPRNGSGGLRQLCLISVDSSGMRTCSLGLPRPSFHSCLVNHIHFFPQLKQNSENLRTVSTNKQLWLITCSAWHGQVWLGQLV